ncbi:hypothetical protein PPEP_b1159 [Pseudoalteromonas peptidolytica F12-50-A1]|uniref:Uncharacterized protein n=1 Tax=Pseudoalteromonas peptidolytica F12-50-A1 TaxID=1315280 RepID=A0A8I0N1P7_9GAMM|nr:hypothetical protein [Pseudoalteromonas peptidolytica F12-50-A1]
MLCPLHTDGYAHWYYFVLVVVSLRDIKPEVQAISVLMEKVK